MRWSLAKANLNWYEYAWAMLPLILAPVGGFVGGLCGGGAAALNIYLFGRKLRVVTKFLVTGVISNCRHHRLLALRASYNSCPFHRSANRPRTANTACLRRLKEG